MQSPTGPLLLSALLKISVLRDLLRENGRMAGRGEGGEAGRGSREANMLNVYEKCPTLKHLSQEIVLIALPLHF